MDRGGYEDAKTTQDVKTGYDFDRPTKTAIPDAFDGPGSSPEADLQRAIRKNPADKNNYLKLADLYSRDRRLEDAQEALKKALDVSGGDPNVRELLEDNELEQLRQNVDLARQNAATDPVANKNYHDWKTELRKREIEVFSSRIERYPKDSRWKYELAQRYIKLKEWKKAIPLLQQSVIDVRLQGDVRVALAKCFIAEKNHLLARRQLEQAVQSINPHDNTELFAEAHYILAMLCEDAQEIDAAETHYNEVLGVDYAYKDARERMEKLQRGGNAPGK
jgi:Flp pilus assembly protein TadD